MKHLNNYINKEIKEVIEKYYLPKTLNKDRFVNCEMKFVFNLFNEKTKTQIPLQWYLNYKQLIKYDLSNLLVNIRDEYFYNVLDIVFKENIISENFRIPLNLSIEKINILKKYLNIEDINKITSLFLNKEKFCKKCGKIKNIIFSRKIVCLCEKIDNCIFCNKDFFTKKQLLEHYTKIHNYNWYQENKPQNIDIYCIFCKSKLDYSVKYGNKINVYLCKNKDCLDYEKRDNQRILNFKQTINNRTDFDSSNYINASILRERKFKNTFLETGESLKENISKKTGKKISKTLKEKIRRGDFTPCVTNSWCGSKIKYKNLEFRSSWEVYFYLLNEDKVEYEKTRIQYFDSKQNKLRNYIIDFTNDHQKILYEIKPSSKVNDQRNIDKFVSAEKYCKENNYSFIIIDEKYLQNNINRFEKIFIQNINYFENESITKIKKLIKKLKVDYNENS